MKHIIWFQINKVLLNCVHYKWIIVLQIPRYAVDRSLFIDLYIAIETQVSHILILRILFKRKE